MSHIQECLKCERSKGAGKSIQRELEEVREDIEELLWKRHPNQSERELLRCLLRKCDLALDFWLIL